MTTKEKADSIFQQIYKFLWHTNSDPIHCKQCAIVAVDEVISAIPNEYLDCWQGECQMILNEDIEYWQKVKQEIEKL
jgi:hypothetical protein